MLSAFGDGVWRAIFAVNLPLGLISIYLLLSRFPPMRRRKNAASISAVPRSRRWRSGTRLWADLDERRGRGPDVGAEHCRGVVLLVVFIVFELRQREPMIDLSLFRIGALAGANVATFFLYFALSANFSTCRCC